MKRILCITLVLCLFLGGCQSYSEEEDLGSFTFKKTYSYDEKFYAVQDVDDQDSIVVSVYTSDGEFVNSFRPARAWDFWGICWENDTYNIWIQSGDIGVYCYTYDDGEWHIDYEVQRPDYILSKYDNDKDVGEVIYYDDYSVYVD